MKSGLKFFGSGATTSETKKDTHEKGLIATPGPPPWPEKPEVQLDAGEELRQRLVELNHQRAVEEVEGRHLLSHRELGIVVIETVPIGAARTYAKAGRDHFNDEARQPVSGLICVLTGDLVHSTRMPDGHLGDLMAALADEADRIRKTAKDIHEISRQRCEGLQCADGVRESLRSGHSSILSLGVEVRVLP